MKFFSKLKSCFFNSFRTFLLYHHNSLEFRAKILALIIMVDEKKNQECYMEKVRIIAHEIYKDETRVESLYLTVQEYLHKSYVEKSLSEDRLIYSILKELKNTFRYYKKINIEQIERLLECSKEKDTLDYQKSIIRFLQEQKSEADKKSAKS